MLIFVQKHFQTHPLKSTERLGSKWKEIYFWTLLYDGCCILFWFPINMLRSCGGCILLPLVWRVMIFIFIFIVSLMQPTLERRKYRPTDRCSGVFSARIRLNDSKFRLETTIARNPCSPPTSSARTMYERERRIYYVSYIIKLLQKFSSIRNVSFTVCPGMPRECTRFRNKNVRQYCQMLFERGGAFF